MMFSPQDTPIPEKRTSHVQEPLSDWSMDPASGKETEARNHSPVHWGNYASCVPLRKEEHREKNP